MSPDTHPLREPIAVVLGRKTKPSLEIKLAYDGKKKLEVKPAALCWQWATLCPNRVHTGWCLSTKTSQRRLNTWVSQELNCIILASKKSQPETQSKQFLEHSRHSWTWWLLFILCMSFIHAISCVIRRVKGEGMSHIRTGDSWSAGFHPKDSALLILVLAKHQPVGGHRGAEQL